MYYYVDHKSCFPCVIRNLMSMNRTTSGPCVMHIYWEGHICGVVDCSKFLTGSGIGTSPLHKCCALECIVMPSLGGIRRHWEIFLQETGLWSSHVWRPWCVTTLDTGWQRRQPLRLCSSRASRWVHLCHTFTLGRRGAVVMSQLPVEYINGGHWCTDVGRRYIVMWCSIDAMVQKIPDEDAR